MSRSKDSGLVADRPSLVPLGAVVLALSLLAPVSAPAQDLILDDRVLPDFPQDIWDNFPFPVDDFPIPRPSPEEEFLRDCLLAVNASIHVEQLVYGVRPLIALPHRGVLCRIEQQAEVLRSAEPDRLLVPLQVGVAVEGTFEEVRDIHSSWMKSARNHFAHLQVLEGQLARIESMSEARGNLAASFGRLSTAPPQDWRALSRSYRIGQEPACQKHISPPSAEAPEGRGNDLSVEEEWEIASEPDPVSVIEDLKFLPDLRDLFDGVNLSAGVLLPQQVDSCERGTVQASCADTPVIAWSDDCWQSIELEEQIDWPCKAQQPQVRNAPAVGSGCSGDFESFHTPFFTAPAARDRRGGVIIDGDDPAPIRFARGVGWDELAAALDAWTPAAEQTAAKFRSVRDEDLAPFRQPFERLASFLDLEGQTLDAERRRLDQEREFLSGLEMEIETARSEFQSHQEEEARLTDELRGLEEEIEGLDESSTEAEKRFDIVGQDRERQSAIADSVELDCGGRPYDDCPDDRAKLDFDRSFYEALEALAEIDTEYGRQFDLVVRLRNESFGLTIRRARNQVFLAQTTRLKALAERKLRDLEAQYAERKAVYDADESVYRRVRASLQEDQDSREMMDRYLDAGGVVLEDLP